MLLGELLELNVDVVEHFNVVAQEADRLDENARMALGFETQDCVFHRRADPRSTRHTLTLKSKDPIFVAETSRMRHQFSRLMRLRLIWITFSDRALGNAMSSKDDREVARRLRGSPGPVMMQSLGKALDEERLVMPGFNEVKRNGGTLALDGFSIKSYAGPGILWREADNDRVLYTIADHGLDRLGDERLPISHADVYRTV